MTSQILIIGCGDIGQRVGALHRAQGHAVMGVVRRADAALALQAQGITPITADLDGDWPIPAADAIYWCAPPPAKGVDDLRFAQALIRLPAPAQGMLYISTTGVYGDCAGRWIDESEPLKPKSERGQRRLAAELHLRAWAARTGAKAVTLRVPGIYGPGRLPVERLHKGEPILCAQDSPFTNRIHADDLAVAAVLALARGAAGAAYNVSDGQPTTMTDYFLQCATLLGVPAPPQISLAEARKRLSPMLLSFFEESKRIQPSRLKALGFNLRHANLASGLPQCLDGAGYN